MIVGGYGFAGSLKDVETITITDGEGVTKSTCQVAGYPKKIAWHAGTLSSNNILVCGGYPKTNDCNTYNHQSKQWEATTKMTSKRSGHSMVTIDDKTYAIAGYDSNFLNSAEVLSNVGWSSIANLPISMGLHCSVALNNNTIFTTGGYDGSVSK